MTKCVLAARDVPGKGPENEREHKKKERKRNGNPPQWEVVEALSASAQIPSEGQTTKGKRRMADSQQMQSIRIDGT